MTTSCKRCSVSHKVGPKAGSEALLWVNAVIGKEDPEIADEKCKAHRAADRAPGNGSLHLLPSGASGSCTGQLEKSCQDYGETRFIDFMDFIATL